MFCTFVHVSCIHAKLLQLCLTLQTAAHQAPLSTGFSRQEYGSGLPFPSPCQHLSNCLKQKLAVTLICVCVCVCFIALYVNYSPHYFGQVDSVFETLLGYIILAIHATVVLFQIFIVSPAYILIRIYLLVLPPVSTPKTQSYNKIVIELFIFSSETSVYILSFSTCDTC